MISVKIKLCHLQTAVAVVKVRNKAYNNQTWRKNRNHTEKTRDFAEIYKNLVRNRK